MPQLTDQAPALVGPASSLLSSARIDNLLSCHAGLTAIEIGLLTELYWGLPLRSYFADPGNFASA